MSKRKFIITLYIIIIVFLILGAITGYIGYYYYHQYTQLKTNPQLLATKQTQELVAQVSSLMRLPTDEIPQIATVVNPTLVQAHTPFSQAETGDVILIYTKMKRAILYRPSAHKIIDVAPVIIGALSPSQKPAQLPTPSTDVISTPSTKPTLHIGHTNK